MNKADRELWCGIRKGLLQVVDAIERRTEHEPRTAILRGVVRDLGHLHPEVHRDLCRMQPVVEYGEGTSVAGTSGPVVVRDGGRETRVPGKETDG